VSSGDTKLVPIAPRAKPAPPQTLVEQAFGPVEEVRGTRRATRGLYVGRTIADLEGAELIDTPHNT